ncbi:MAG: radical SAM protein [Deltaproteobacteria bacterium]|nr:radical SAM protein [Deltaproteobacteria bacterium]
MILFDRSNGAFLRYGRNDVDPFANVDGPELLDISLTNFCERGCEFCYRQSNTNGKFMNLDDFAFVTSQAKKAGVLQVALGGGNPNQHPQFVDILKIARQNDIIPSYTTNGQGLTDEIYRATKEFGGAMAVSWYEPYVEAMKTIDEANSYDITVNIHFLLSQASLAQAIDLLENGEDILKKINAAVFLNYKPIHSSEELRLTPGNDIEHFFELAKNLKSCRIGFDSCMISYLPLLGDELAQETVDFCEAGRFSAYISEELLFYPCSFMNDMSERGIDLRETSLAEAWKHGEEFVKIRERLSSPGRQAYPISACSSCDSYQMCHGGCQILDINYCRRQGS